MIVTALNRRIAAPLTAVLVGAGIAAAAVPASAATRTVTEHDGSSWLKATVSVSDVVMRTGETKVVVDVTYRASDRFTLDGGNFVTIHSSSGYGFDMATLRRVSPTKERAELVIDPGEVAGTWWVDVYSSADVWDSCLYSWDGCEGGYEYLYLSQDSVTSFQASRAAAVTVGAASTTVAKGRTTTLDGTLKHVVSDHRSTSWRAYPNQKVTLWFDPAGSAPGRWMGSATTNSNGAYRKTIKPTTSGVWTVTYPGSSVNAPAKASVTVRVR
jgi:hypothetical protein